MATADDHRANAAGPADEPAGDTDEAVYRSGRDRVAAVPAEPGEPYGGGPRPVRHLDQDTADRAAADPMGMHSTPAEGAPHEDLPPSGGTLRPGEGTEDPAEDPTDGATSG